MIAAIPSAKRVVGGDLLLLIWGICTAAYLAFGFFRRKNRGRRQLLTGLLISEVLVDLAMYLIFFPSGEYHNWGVGGVYAVFLWPMMLTAAYVLTAVFGSEET